jgi:hypothetical protein
MEISKDLVAEGNLNRLKSILILLNNYKKDHTNMLNNNINCLAIDKRE